MNDERTPRETPFSRRRFLARAATATGAATTWALLAGRPASGRAEEAGQQTARDPVKAFCIDFNWGDHGASEPGLYAQADPQEHVRWYQDLGANTIQTFCVSYNGYAWYPSDVAPITPGLRRPNFLGEMVELGHKAGMKVFGYFTLGANPY